MSLMSAQRLPRSATSASESLSQEERCCWPNIFINKYSRPVLMMMSAPESHHRVSLFPRYLLLTSTGVTDGLKSQACYKTTAS